MTVKDYFNTERISLDMVVVASDVSTYWKGATDFVIKIWNTDIDHLSSKQVDWLTKILEDLTEMRIKGAI